MQALFTQYGVCVCVCADPVQSQTCAWKHTPYFVNMACLHTSCLVYTGNCVGGHGVNPATLVLDLLHALRLSCLGTQMGVTSLTPLSGRDSGQVPTPKPLFRFESQFLRWCQELLLGGKELRLQPGVSRQLFSSSPQPARLPELPTSGKGCCQKDPGALI